MSTKKAFAVDRGSGCRELDLKPAVQVAIAEALQEAFAELEDDELEGEDGVLVDVLAVDKIIDHVRVAVTDMWEGEATECIDAHVEVQRNQVTVELSRDGMDEAFTFSLDGTCKAATA
jgi:hypothetical protein